MSDIMTDIAERLLDRSDHYLPDWVRQVMDEAADEIVRLRATARGWYDQNADLIAQRDKVWDENKKLRDEIERLTADLEAANTNAIEAWEQRDQYMESNVKLVAEIERLRVALANERELCAQVCDEMAARGWNKDYGAAEGMKWCAEAIRALTD